ncbi:protein eyes shut isoform X2 [Adelges cooleyi]|uniref:protein eyes shut isoform X2 n=1 Tax=Adelges cooleyi TaxID=133065 RepID=UPI00217FBDCA|nr:protein eyes shut isoform X2 [Adelges cooleyi]
MLSNKSHQWSLCNAAAFVAVAFAAIATVSPEKTNSSVLTGHDFGGFACASSPCVYGICVDQAHNSYTCYCIDGYTGVRCQTNWDECWSSPCQNGGTCVDGIADFNCSCPEGYTGHDCEFNVDECQSNPCQNNGTCIDYTNSFVCQCLAGYAGTTCEVDLAVCNSTGETICKNGGECVEGPGMTFSCICSPGWTGQTCDKEVDQCSSGPCQNGGACVNKQTSYYCACLFGYTGRDCDVALRLCDSHQCQNNALCLVEEDVSVCYCVPDFHGKHCEYQYDECQLANRCLNGGTCVDGVDGYTCSCPKGLSGKDCDCAVIDDHTVNCTGWITPYNSTVEETTAAFSSTPIPESRFTTTWTVPNSETVPTFITSTSWDDDYSHTGFRILSTTTTVASTTFGEQDLESVTPLFNTEMPPDTFRTYDTTAVHTTTTELTTVEATTAFPLSNSFNEPTQVAANTTEENARGFTATTDTFSTTTKTIATTSTTTPPETTEFFSMYMTTTTSSKPLVDSTATTGSPDGAGKTVPPTRTPLVATDYPTYSPTENVAMLTTFYDNFDFHLNFTTDLSAATERVKTGSSICALCINGKCVKSKTGFQCKCSFGWKGEMCDEKINIKVPAFTGKSFLSHRLSNRSGTQIAMELRTLAPNGILFFAQVTTHMYMCLYLQDGLLKFQFSCGVQTMLFSETRYRVNTGHHLLLTATLEHAMSHSMSEHCKASLRVNDTLAMSGEQAADTTLSKKISKLYLGGLPPDQNATEMPVAIGITGCITHLKIDEVEHNVYENAIDGLGVIECASLTCLSSPCQSYATCVEFGDSWNCLCPSGFVGKNCEKSVCENNPCKFGATCVIYPGSGFICLCPLGKHGMYCEHDLEIGDPFFPGSVSGLSSYAAYSIPAEIHQSFELSLHFVPNSVDQIALMMYIGHDASSDHVALSFIKGYIVLTWNLGAGPRRIFTPKPIDYTPNKAHVVKLGRNGKTAWLAVDNFANVTGQSVGRLTQLNTSPVIYLGGHESPGLTDLPHDLPLHTGFVGCMSSVQLKAGHVTMPLSLTHAYTAINSGRSVSQCSTNECYRNDICQHNGACIQHGSSLACVCADGWFGPVCAHRYNACDSNRHVCAEGSTCVPVGSAYECDCPVGRSGKNCERQERLSDVRFTGKRSFLSVPMEAEPNAQQFSIELEIKPTIDEGIVFFVEYDRDQKKFLCLSLYGGIPELTVSVQSEVQRVNDVVVVRSSRVLTLSEWHSVRVGRYRRKLYLWVDGMINYAIMRPSEAITNFDNSIYFGGLPDLSRLPRGATAGLPVPYAGCIRRLSIDYEVIPLNSSTIAAGRNLADCDGTPCGGDLCYHGGNCWLDMDMKPHCHCPREFTGDSCGKQVSCNEFKCQNNGQCVQNSNGSSSCQCAPGWDGPFCTKELPTGPPLFRGHGYMVLSKLSSLTKREDKDEDDTTDEQFMSLKFSTTYEDGLILWTSRNGTWA